VIAAASLLVTSSQFDSLSQAFIVASTSLLISTLIGMLLTTWLASRASNMNSVAVFAGLMFWGWLWGIPGMLLGTPLMMATKVMGDRIHSLNWLGTFLGDAPKREIKHTHEESDAVAANSIEGLTDRATNGEVPLVAAEMAAEITTENRGSRTGKPKTADDLSDPYPLDSSALA